MSRPVIQQLTEREWNSPAERFQRFNEYETYLGVVSQKANRSIAVLSIRVGHYYAKLGGTAETLFRPFYEGVEWVFFILL